MTIEEKDIAPDWEHVHFKVACARCGHDLYGHAEPTCPACKLEFDWAVAVPVHSLICESCDYHLYGLSETRCPECGSDFTWEGALDHYRHLQKPLFEYRWRVEPLRSLVRTWLWALWPPKIWKNVDIHDPPKVGPLLFMLVPCMVSFVVGIITMASTIIWAVSLRNYPTVSWTGVLDVILEIWDYAVDLAGKPNTYFPALVASLWLLMSLAALTAFPQSMSKCRVRYVHILRVWVYATPMFLPPYIFGIGITFLALFCFAADSFSVFGAFGAVTALGIYGILFAHVVWSTWWAYKKYIRMRHSFWVAVSAQVMAVLATMTVFAVHAAARYW